MASRYEESILVSIRRMIRAIDLHSRQLAREHELTAPQLVCLRHTQQQGVTSPTELARAVSLSQATVTGIVDRLEKRGLLNRRRSPSDKRKVLLELTDTGQKLIATAPSPLSERFSRRLEALPEGEQAVIDWIFSRVVTMLEAEDIEAAPMMATGPLTASSEEVSEFLEVGEDEKP